MLLCPREELTAILAGGLSRDWGRPLCIAVPKDGWAESLSATPQETPDAFGSFPRGRWLTGSGRQRLP